MKRWISNRLCRLASRLEAWAEWLRDVSPRGVVYTDPALRGIVEETLRQKANGLADAAIDCNNALLARLMRGRG